MGSESGIRRKPTPDTGVQKHRILDPESGSETLAETEYGTATLYSRAHVFC
jgi:hypothetical protein